MLSKFHLIFFCLLVILSCNSPINNDIIVINTNPKEKIKLKHEFKAIEIISLETTDSSLIGFRVEGFKCFHDKLYFQNRLPSHVNLLCFNPNGSFLFKIDSPGRGPAEYSYFGDFFIDSIKKEICIVSENNRYLFYDINGDFLTSKRSTDDYMPRQIVTREGNYIAFHDPKDSPEEYDLFTLDPKTMNIKEKSKYPGKSTFYTGGHVLCTTKERTLYYHFNDTIYDITDIDNRKAVFYIDSGKVKSRTKKELRENEEIFGLEKTTPLLEKAMINGKLSLITSIFENESWLLIEGIENSKAGINANQNIPTTYILLYNKHNHKIYHSKEIMSVLFGEIEINNIKMLGGDYHSFYWLINKTFSSDEIGHINKSSELSSKDKKYLANRKEDENPFLIRFN